MGDSKAYIIALAAFAVTATGVHAYSGGKVLQRAGLSSEQAEAFEEAHELRRAGDLEKARNVLVSAGVTEDTISSIKQVARTAKRAIHEAVRQNDYQAFRVAVADSPLADIIITEADFATFVEAHTLMKRGQASEAQTLFTELGVPQSHYNHGRGGYGNRHSFLSEAEQAALRVAKQANDRAAVEAILEEAGVAKHRAVHHR